MKTLHVEDPGPLTTVQDGGRYGFQDKGVPVSGAMDQAALGLGNLLVGNTPGTAALEVFWGGFRARFLSPCVFAVTGFDPRVTLNTKSVDPWSACSALPGDVLTVEAGDGGLWHYVCLAGGIQVPLVLGSRSTYLRGRLGGLEGRSLRKGDILETGSRAQPAVGRIPERLRPSYARHPTVRVILGPQDDAFAQESIDEFLTTPYRVTPRSDRMGMMLDGPRLKHRRSPDIVSEGLAFGAVQVPGEGLPFVLLADRPTTGGYTKIATVFSCDLPLLVQTVPGRSVRFQAVDLLEARERLLRRNFLIRRFLERSGQGSVQNHEDRHQL